MLTKLQKRAVELSFKHKLTHVSSVLNTVPVLQKIYDDRQDHEPVVVGNGHASLAHYVVLEAHGLCDAEEMIRDYGTHASRDMKRGVWVSNGSLGQAETVAVGLALADPTRKVWLVTSDGACMEGAVWEAMRITAMTHCDNLHVRLIANGYGAYRGIYTWELPNFPTSFVAYYRDNRLPRWLQGLDGHYLTLTGDQYNELMA